MDANARIFMRPYPSHRAPCWCWLIARPKAITGTSKILLHLCFFLLLKFFEAFPGRSAPKNGSVSITLDAENLIPF